MFVDSYKNDGVTMTVSFGGPYPEAFEHPQNEYRALTSTAALIDLCHWGLFRLTGGDRLRLLNSLTTNDAASLAAGEACHSALTTVKGKLIAELFVLVRDADATVLVAQGDPGTVHQTIGNHIVADDVDLENVSDGYGVLSVEGPKSREIVWRLFPRLSIPTKRFQFVDVIYQGIPATIMHNNVTGETGYQLIVPKDGIRLIRDYLIQAGRAEDAALAGRAAWNMRRVEAGLPWWGADVKAEENFPKECRLDGVVSYDKGCFLGQETLARMHHRGHPNWLLVGLSPNGEVSGLDTPAFLSADSIIDSSPDSISRALGDLNTSASIPAGSELFAPDDPSKSVGRITSSAFSPKTQKPLFMGYARAALASPGTELVLPVGGVESTLVVIPLPVE
jgi:folate-binding protein YgfZ